jgi:hypothetical protein
MVDGGQAFDKKDGIGDSLVYNTDENGDVIWSKSFDHPEFDSNDNTKNIIETSSGNIIALVELHVNKVDYDD